MVNLGAVEEVLAQPPVLEIQELEVGSVDGSPTVPKPSQKQLDHMVESIAAIEQQNYDLMRRITHFTAALTSSMEQVALTAQNVRVEADQLKVATGAVDCSETEEQGKKLSPSQLFLEEERRLQELRREERRVRRALEAASARLAEVTSQLNEVDKDAGTVVKLAALLTDGIPLNGDLNQRTAQGSVGRPSGSQENKDIGNSAVKEEFNVTAETIGAAIAREQSLGLETVVTGAIADGEGEDDDALGPDAVALPDTLQCLVSHPGALACTKTSIQKDEMRHTAVVTLEATVRCAGDACLAAGVKGDDYVALALQAISDTASDLKRTHYQRAIDSDPLLYEKHHTITEILAEGKVVSCSPMEPPSDFGHVSFVSQLRNRKTGVQIGAMVKPRIKGDADGWHRAPIEWVAYELNLLLGMDYVPPVVYRRGGIDVDWNHYEEGAFIYWVPNCRQLKSVPASDWGVSVARLLSDTRILDVLLNNSDRHHGHFFHGEHWTDKKMRPVLIDHAAGFRKEAVVNMLHENAFQTGPVRCVSASTYLRLRFLDKEILTAKFSEVLSSEEIEEMMQRRDMVLDYLDNLVKERGYHRTVIE